MTALRDAVVSDTLTKVHVVYVDRATCKFWNERRGEDDTVIFTGFYWLKGREENGPFKTKSACLRDAYYRFVLKRSVPQLGSATVAAAHAPPKRKTRHQETETRAH